MPILRPVPRASPQQPAALPESEPAEADETSAPHDTVADLRAIAPRRQG